jgi:uncharacterized LabA/DUF88 family protein
MERVIAYIDGLNLYYGLRSKGWKRFYWVDIQALARHLLRQNQTLVETKYFTTIVKEPKEKRQRQTIYIDALKTLTDIKIFYGQFLSESIVCRKCGHTYTTYHEKMTDVNITVELLADALNDRFDVALLVSADSDLVRPVMAVQELYKPKRVVAVFPPGHTSFALKHAVKAALHITHVELAKSLLPEQIERPGSVTLHRPKEWEENAPAPRRTSGTGRRKKQIKTADQSPKDNQASPAS